MRREEIVEESDSTDNPSINGRYHRFNVKLGKGAFKEVYKAFDTHEQIDVAWNSIDLSLINTDDERKKIFKECEMLRRLNHPNILKITNQWFNDKTDKLCFITNLVHDGSLAKFFRKRQVNLLRVKHISKQILEALFYLHQNGVIHRDLKCDNIFIEGNTGKVVLGDLGLSCNVVSARSIVGTPHWMAPELYKEDYNEKVDIWSFGMCVLELISSEIPYNECKGAFAVYQRISQGQKPESLKKINDRSVRAILNICLNINHTQRPSAEELLDHPFLYHRHSDTGLCSQLMIEKNTEPKPSETEEREEQIIQESMLRPPKKSKDSKSSKKSSKSKKTRAKKSKGKKSKTKTKTKTKTKHRNGTPFHSEPATSPPPPITPKTRKVGVSVKKVRNNGDSIRIKLQIVCNKFSKPMNVEFDYNHLNEQPASVAKEMTRDLELPNTFTDKVEKAITVAIAPDANKTIESRSRPSANFDTNPSNASKRKQSDPMFSKPKTVNTATFGFEREKAPMNIMPMIRNQSSPDPELTMHKRESLSISNPLDDISSIGSIPQPNTNTNESFNGFGEHNTPIATLTTSQSVPQPMPMHISPTTAIYHYNGHIGHNGHTDLTGMESTEMQRSISQQSSTSTKSTKSATNTPKLPPVPEPKTVHAGAMLEPQLQQQQKLALNKSNMVYRSISPPKSTTPPTPPPIIGIQDLHGSRSPSPHTLQPASNGIIALQSLNSKSSEPDIFRATLKLTLDELIQEFVKRSKTYNKSEGKNGLARKLVNILKTEVLKDTLGLPHTNKEPTPDSVFSVKSTSAESVVSVGGTAEELNKRRDSGRENVLKLTNYDSGGSTDQLYDKYTNNNREHNRTGTAVIHRVINRQLSKDEKSTNGSYNPNIGHITNYSSASSASTMTIQTNHTIGNSSHITMTSNGALSMGCDEKEIDLPTVRALTLPFEIEELILPSVSNDIEFMGDVLNQISTKQLELHNEYIDFVKRKYELLQLRYATLDAESKDNETDNGKSKVEEENGMKEKINKKRIDLTNKFGEWLDDREQIAQLKSRIQKKRSISHDKLPAFDVQLEFENDEQFLQLMNSQLSENDKRECKQKIRHYRKAMMDDYKKFYVDTLQMYKDKELKQQQIHT